jgi:hypothetical protein
MTEENKIQINTKDIIPEVQEMWEINQNWPIHMQVWVN